LASGYFTPPPPPSERPLPSEQTPNMHLAFNYWKAVICCKSPQLYGLIQAEENRVRMFAGLIWATGVSVVICAVELFFLWHSPLFYPLLVFTIVSLALFGVFVCLLRPNRYNEARTVFLAYLSLQPVNTGLEQDVAFDRLNFLSRPLAAGD
jgi:hypothetical protein